jgi:DNA repair ATPase RecN
MQPSSQSAKPTTLGALLEWTKPYRETIAIVVAVTAAISGAVSWTVAHFATQAELHFLECRMTNNIVTQLMPVYSREFSDRVDWRMEQIMDLAKRGGGTPDSISRISELKNQVDALTKDQAEQAANLKKEIDDIARQCIQEAPNLAGKP